MTTNKEPQPTHTKSISSFVSGGIAGVVAKTIIAPIERIKFLFIVQFYLSRKTSHRKFTYQLFFSDASTIVSKHGLRNLWRGNIMNVARVFPHAAIVKLNIFRTSRCLTS